MFLTTNYQRLAVRYSLYDQPFHRLRQPMIKYILYEKFIRLGFSSFHINDSDFNVREFFSIISEDQNKFIKYFDSIGIKYSIISQDVTFGIEELHKLCPDLDNRLNELKNEKNRLKFIMEKIEKEWGLEDHIYMFFIFDASLNKPKWVAEIPIPDEMIKTGGVNILMDYLTDNGCGIFRFSHSTELRVWLQ